MLALAVVDMAMRMRFLLRHKPAQGLLSSTDDFALNGFATIFASSPTLHAELLGMPKDEHAVVVPAWMLPAVDTNAHTCSNGAEICDEDNNRDESGRAAEFHFDVYADADMTRSAVAQSSSSLALSICFTNEHAPHPIQQLQPCFDAEANAVILLRLPLLVVEAISMAKASNNEGPLRATEHELGEAEVHCMAASQAAVKNGLYM